MTQDLFGSQTKPEDKTNETQTQDSEYLQMFVGEERKYRDTEALAKGMFHLDEHRAKLEEENAKLREQLAKAATVDDVLKRLDEKKESASTDKTGSQSELTESDLLRIVDKVVTGRETAKTKESNRNLVNQKMTEAFGEKAMEIFKSKANTPALAQMYGTLAETSPQDFLDLFIEKGGSTAGRSQASTTGTNSAGFSGSQNFDREKTPGTKEYYNALRRTNSSRYYSREIQLEIQKAASENPNKYYGRS